MNGHSHTNYLDTKPIPTLLTKTNFEVSFAAWPSLREREWWVTKKYAHTDTWRHPYYTHTNTHTHVEERFKGEWKTKEHFLGVVGLELRSGQ